MSQISYGTITITDISSSSSTNQHFWFNPTQQGTLLAGAYITDIDIDTFKSNKAGGYVLARSNGIEFGRGAYKSVELIAGTQNDALNFYEPNSNDLVASFGDNVQIGKSTTSHIEIASNSFIVYGNDGTTPHLRIRDGIAESGQVVDTFIGTGVSKNYNLTRLANSSVYTVTVDNVAVTPTSQNQVSFTLQASYGAIIVATYNSSISAIGYDFGKRKTDSITGEYSIIEGFDSTASGRYSHAEGWLTVAGGSYSHAEGHKSIATANFSHTEGSETIAVGAYSHAEGNQTIAMGSYSHVEGEYSKASGNYSHAEGYNTKALGDGSHAEGYVSTSSGDHSHAEGLATVASGDASHAQNDSTIANAFAQTAIGVRNIEDTTPSTTVHGDGVEYGHYALIVGNGTLNTGRSNAATIDWQGNLRLAGKVYINGTGDLSNATLDPLQSSKVLTNFTQPTLTNGTHYNNGVRYIGLGCFVFIYVSVKFNSAPSFVPLFTLPQGYRPVAYSEISVSGGNANAKAQCIIDTSGRVTVSSADSWVVGSGIFVRAS